MIVLNTRARRPTYRPVAISHFFFWRARYTRIIIIIIFFSPPPHGSGPANETDREGARRRPIRTRVTHGLADDACRRGCGGEERILIFTGGIALLPGTYILIRATQSHRFHGFVFQSPALVRVFSSRLVVISHWHFVFNFTTRRRWNEKHVYIAGVAENLARLYFLGENILRRPYPRLKFPRMFLPIGPLVFYREMCIFWNIFTSLEFYRKSQISFDIFRTLVLFSVVNIF